MCRPYAVGETLTSRWWIALKPDRAGATGSFNLFRWKPLSEGPNQASNSSMSFWLSVSQWRLAQEALARQLLHKGEAPAWSRTFRARTAADENVFAALDRASDV